MRKTKEKVDNNNNKNENKNKKFDKIKNKKRSVEKFLIASCVVRWLYAIMTYTIMTCNISQISREESS